MSDASDPELVAAAGQTIAEYTGDDGLALYSAIAPDGEQFGSPALLADAGERSVTLAGDGSGNAITAFDENSTSSNQGNLMADTFAADTPPDGPAQGSAPAGGPASSATTTPSLPALSEASVGVNPGASQPGITNLGRLALHLASAIARFARGGTRATVPARCVTASAHTCLFGGRLLAARWQRRTQKWITTQIQLGTSAGTLHRPRLGQLTVQLAPAGVTALRHIRIVNAWLSGTLRSSGRRISVAVLIRLER